MVVCLEQSANDLQMVQQLMPLPSFAFINASLKSRMGWPRPTTQVVLEKRSLSAYCYAFTLEFSSLMASPPPLNG